MRARKKENERWGLPLGYAESKGILRLIFVSAILLILPVPQSMKTLAIVLLFACVLGCVQAIFLKVGSSENCSILKLKVGESADVYYETDGENEEET